MHNSKTFAGLMLLVGLLAGFFGGYFFNQNQKPAVLPADNLVEIEPATESIIKIGYLAPLSGPGFVYGSSIEKGIKIAWQEATTGKIELITADSLCSPVESTKAMNKLIEQDGVVAVIGDVCPESTLAAAIIAQEKKVPLIAPTPVETATSTTGDFIFRLASSDAEFAQFIADYLRQQNYEKLGIVNSSEQRDSAFGQAISASFLSLSGQILQEVFTPGSLGLKTQLEKIKTFGPDALYIISDNQDSSIAALKQIRELGLATAVYGTQNLKSLSLVAAAGEAAEGLTVIAHNSGSDEFIFKHHLAFSETPGPFAAYGYDAMKALVLAIGSGATDRQSIKDALSRLKFNGATGNIEFGGDRATPEDFEIHAVINGEFKKLNK